jgi:integrase
MGAARIKEKMMGRLPTKNRNLPTGMRVRVRGKLVYYYLDKGGSPRVEISLGKNYVEAVRKWAEETTNRESVGAVVSFKDAADSYVRSVIPKKAPETQKLNLRELANLLAFFGDARESIESIKPIMVRQYLDWRAKQVRDEKMAANAERVKSGRTPVAMTGTEGHVPANREKALLSHIWNFARETGLTNLANPCAGIKGFKEAGRDAYIDDAIYSAVWDVAEPGLRDAMDLAYLSAQRKADVLKFSRTDLKDDQLTVVQNKTGKRLRVSVEGQLATVIERINRRKVAGIALVCNDKGERMTEFMLRGAFDRARVAAVEKYPHLAKAIRDFQFRDLRAKAGTDKEEKDGMDAAQAQLGHSTSAMTSHYVRHRRGKLVKPTK